MAKKVKLNSLLDSAPAQEAIEEANGEQSTFKDASLVGNGQMTAEAKEKLEKYDALEKSVGALSKEKEHLEAKVAEYAEKLAELKTAADQIHDLVEENSKLKKQLENMPSVSSNVEALKREIKSLRDEADGYLVKISELTFENAKMSSQLDELSKKFADAGVSPNQKKYAPECRDVMHAQGGLRPPHTDAYNPYKNNGYGTWN